MNKEKTIDKIEKIDNKISNLSNITNGMKEERETGNTYA